MTDECQSGALLESWLKDTDPTSPDARPSVARVMAQVPQTRQQGRWWWLPSFGRTQALSPTTDDATDFQPTPTPASNGRAPTVIGRTQTMFSPVKAITVGALVFALGGVLLIAQPFDQRGGGVPGAETPGSTGVAVTVTQQCTDVVNDGCRWTASDPRLTGTISTDWGDAVAVEGAKRLEAGFQWIGNTFYSPEGGGTGHVYALWGEPTQNFLVLSGTGAIEGWHYIASGTDPDSDGDFEWIGTLYEGELPPFPKTAE